MPVSNKDSFRIIMALVAYFDLELHQIDVKTAFHNGNLSEEIYVTLPKGLQAECTRNIVCKLKRSIYRCTQAFQQWYLKFNDTINSFGFKENTFDRYVYLKGSGSKFIFFILYVDDILLTNSDLGILYVTKNLF